jgi:hypothetical protein
MLSGSNAVAFREGGRVHTLQSTGFPQKPMFTVYRREKVDDILARLTKSCPRVNSSSLYFPGGGGGSISKSAKPKSDNPSSYELWRHHFFRTGPYPRFSRGMVGEGGIWGKIIIQSWKLFQGGRFEICTTSF